MPDSTAVAQLSSLPVHAEPTMRHLSIIFALTTLAGCAGPLPAVNPQQAWVDMRTITGKLVMADKVDSKSTYDGRYFQVSPGSHKLQVRYDYELNYAGFSAVSDDFTERTCYIELKYDHFTAGQRYMIEVRSLSNYITAWLYDAQGKELVEQDESTCI
jgi:hypothetical protein